jgi:hypothetical protein
LELFILQFYPHSPLFLLYEGRNKLENIELYHLYLNLIYFSDLFKQWDTLNDIFNSVEHLIVVIEFKRFVDFLMFIDNLSLLFTY